MSELIKERPPVEAQQYISVYEALNEYADYYLTVNCESDQVTVWQQDYYSESPTEDRQFAFAGFREVALWLRDAAEGDVKDEPDLGEWTKLPNDECSLLLPCGDTIEVSVESIRNLAAALSLMATVDEWGGAPGGSRMA